VLLPPMRYSELAASPTGQGGPIVDYDSIAFRFVQGRGKIAGSANGATPDAIDNDANPTKTITAQTTKVMSVRFFRSHIAEYSIAAIAPCVSPWPNFR
jgi:hypothetical protein